MPTARLAACLLALTACGREQLDSTGFNSVDEDVGASFGRDGQTLGDGSFQIFDGGFFRDTGFGLRDTGFGIPDTGFGIPDTGPRPDIGTRPDTGPRPDAGRRDGGSGRDAQPGDVLISDGGDVGLMFECLSPVDCFVNVGIPPCPNGNWQCLDNKCVPDCPMTDCRTDCDCPFDQGCTRAGCQFVNRQNFCCENPRCPAGQTCIERDQSLSQCGGGFDGGTFDGGFPRDAGRDGGRPRDGSVLFDGAVIIDGSIVFPDSGLTPRDGGVSPDGGGFGDAGNLCRTDCDCDSSLACLGGQCRIAGRLNQCCTNPTCPPGTRCVQPDGSPGQCGATTPVGVSCDPFSPQCGPSGFCIEEQNGFPGGYCSQSCDRRNPCPAGAECRGGGGGGQICLDSCSVPSDCRQPEYNCIQLGVSGSGRVCWPVPPTSTNPNGDPVGAGCGNDDDCETGLTCLQEQNFPNGYCTKLYCDPVTSPCPSASACYAFPGLFSLCLAECPSGGTQSTCRNRYYCLGPTGGDGVCIGN